MTDLHAMLAGWAIFLQDEAFWAQEISFERLNDDKVIAFHPTQASAMGALIRVAKIRAFRIPASIIGTDQEPMLRRSLERVTREVAMPPRPSDEQLCQWI